MLGGKGFYVGSSVLVSGTAGTGKSSLARILRQQRVRRGSAVSISPLEIRVTDHAEHGSIGIDLETPEKKGLLQFFNARPTTYGLEMHLAMIHKLITSFKPAACIFDPVTNLLSASSSLQEVNAMLTRLIDFLKFRHITSLFTSLTTGSAKEETEVGYFFPHGYLAFSAGIGTQRRTKPRLYILKLPAWPIPTRCENLF